MSVHLPSDIGGPPQNPISVCNFSATLTEKLLLYLLIQCTSSVVLVLLLYKIQPFGRRTSIRDACLMVLGYVYLPTLPMAYAVYVLFEDVRFLFYKAWHNRTWRFIVCAVLGSSVQRPDGTTVRLTQITAAEYPRLKCNIHTWSAAWVISVLIWCVSGGIFWYPWPWYISPEYLKDRIDIANHGGKGFWLILLTVLFTNCRWEFAEPSSDSDQDEIQPIREATLEGWESRSVPGDEAQVPSDLSHFRLILSWYERCWRYFELGIYLFLALTAIRHSTRPSDFEKLYLIAPAAFFTALLVPAAQDLDFTRTVLYLAFLSFWPVVFSLSLLFYPLFTLVSKLLGQKCAWVAWIRLRLLFWRKWVIVPLGILWFLLFHFIFTWVRVGLGYAMTTQNCDWNEWWVHRADKRYMFCSYCRYVVD